MTLQQLEYIVALDTHRNFVKAAETCHVSQPTLSMQLKKLEEEWGVLLFQRGNGPLEPTPMGEIVVVRARRVLAESRALEETLHTAKENLSGHLILGVIPTLSPYLLPRFLHQFSQKHPDLHLILREMQSEAILAALKAGEVDAGLLSLPIEDEEIEEMPLFREPLWLCVSDNFPQVDLTPSNLAMHHAGGPMVLTGGHCLRDQVLQFCGTTQPTEAAVVYEGGSLETLIRLVGKGEGYTLVPELAIPDQLPVGTSMRAFPDPQPEREIGLAVHLRFVRRKLIEQLGQAIRASVPPALASGKGRRLTWRN
jgi:LysR family transcriptional regulator, hydrogen peroxide-inducible genes activator